MAIKKLQPIKDATQIVADQMYVMESYDEGALYIGNGLDIVQHLFDHIAVECNLLEAGYSSSQNKWFLRRLWMLLDETQMEQLDQQFNIFKRF